MEDSIDRTRPHLQISSVAVIGAGVSGVAAAIHLNRAGLQVTVFERTGRTGGIWVFDQRVAKDAAYPSLLPSTGESPEFDVINDSMSTDGHVRTDSANGIEVRSPSKVSDRDLALSFAPPGPCYASLKNNVSTIEMEMTSQQWRTGTEEFVSHHVLADYIQDSAVANGVMDSIQFNTRVDRIRKERGVWEVETSRLRNDGFKTQIVNSTQEFNAVVVASGHYHACHIPDTPGLAEWKQRFPESFQHSKLYRSSDKFHNQNVLIIGAGVSSTDIARDLARTARTVFQSSRSGPYDLPSHLLPPNAARIGPIASFDRLETTTERNPDGSLPGTITLKTGQKLCGIHSVIVATGYHISLPFLREKYHADGVRAENASEEILVTDGKQVHNLHKDIWYIPDPTLAFIGVPYHVATFSLFDFQARALAAVFAGKAQLPDRHVMRKEYVDRVARNGAGRTFHSLRAHGAEIAYVDDLVELVNRGSGEGDASLRNCTAMKGHSTRWHEAYARRRKRQEALFSTVRDQELDLRVLDLIEGC